MSEKGFDVYASRTGSDKVEVQLEDGTRSTFVPPSTSFSGPFNVHYTGPAEPPREQLVVGDYWNGLRWTGEGWDNSEIVDQAVSALHRSFTEDDA